MQINALMQYQREGRGYMFSILIENNVGLALINECLRYSWKHLIQRERSKDRIGE